ncbi:hypothetical protein ABID82_007129 [Methylobacterium sp. PvP062]|jgi:hypothetical protein|uniref:DUF2283 domain-containing protein n=1 Tax=Methylobacterium radiotolerans TaxID=31998 RepID=A0ABV2NL20_9HYPH|nr:MULTISPECIES: hypothetical protein [unclassified Methylobacterium]MBP2496100.1 hypothetical protein [Methylobacterium sp. PvP105]MBP2504029.1 hypothetical protein [Methylobacterium sp. PvP109]
MLEKTPAAMAISVRTLLDCAYIDGGDTVAVRFEAADGQIIGVLIPRRVFAALQSATASGSGQEQ